MTIKRKDLDPRRVSIDQFNKDNGTLFEWFELSSRYRDMNGDLVPQGTIDIFVHTNCKNLKGKPNDFLNLRVGYQYYFTKNEALELAAFINEKFGNNG